MYKTRSRSFFCGQPPTSSPLLRSLYKESQVRLYNKELIIGQKSSSQEAAIVSFLSAAQEAVNVQLIPRVYSSFYTGLISEPSQGRFIVSADMRDPKTAGIVARKVATVHKLQPPAARAYELFYGAMEGFASETKANVHKISDSLARQALEILSAVPWEHEINYVHHLMQTCNSPVVFSLNNLGPSNLLISPNDVIFNSVEYAGYNHRAFDLADYLLEASIEKRLTPGSNQISFFTAPLAPETISTYINSYYLAVANHPEVGKSYAGLYEEMLRGRLASHLYWGLWSMYAATVTPHRAHIYAAYGQFRLEQYMSEKAGFPQAAALIPAAPGVQAVQGQLQTVVVSEPYFNGPHYRPWHERIGALYA